ncbi:polynucleotide 5'-hydroxyl-kinase NOL9 [Bemisia tabaci]|uniref:polynucleotide 5'-hydroxyl-kinase NOL9 n=1 Tax=Bemisia tabaci TaxID=7038 RepID=UPI003B28A1E8
MGKPKFKKSKSNEQKLQIKSRKDKKKNKTKELKLAKVVKEHNRANLNIVSNFVSVEDNVRKSIFSSKVSDVTKTRVDSTCVSISNLNIASSSSSLAHLGVEAQLPGNQPAVEDQPNIFADFLQSVKFVVVSSKKVLAICDHTDILYFFGVVKLSILHGQAEVLGYVFNNRTPPSNVFSLRDSGILQVIISKNTQPSLDLRDLKEKIEERCAGIATQTVDRVIMLMKSSSTILLLERSTDTKRMQVFLNSHCKSSIFPTMTSIQEKLMNVEHPEEVKKIERELICQFIHPSEPENFFKVSDQWQPLVDQILSSITSYTGSISLLAGGKGVGKSTLLRYLVNQCLSRTSAKKALVIDLDPGQCEMTLPGCMSVHVVTKPLLGPNFSHLSHSGRVWFLGEINVAQCFDRYLKYLEEILCYCASSAELKKIPWFINTMGFCRGLGVELMSCTINYFRPTHVIQIQSKKDNNNYPLPLSPDIVQRHHRFIKSKVSRVSGVVTHDLSVISSVSNANPNKTNPPERRGAVILSYFSQILPKSTDAITDVIPFVTDVSNLDIIICHGQNLSRAQSLAAINGNLVALCSKSSNDTFNHKCLGFGIVRGIDFSDGRLFLLTPLREDLKDVNCLMMGNTFLPQSIYPQSHSSGHVPYVNIGEGQITSRITRRTFKPASTVSFQGFTAKSLEYPRVKSSTLSEYLDHVLELFSKFSPSQPPYEVTKRQYRAFRIISNLDLPYQKIR